MEKNYRILAISEREFLPQVYCEVEEKWKDIKTMLNGIVLIFNEHKIDKYRMQENILNCQKVIEAHKLQEKYIIIYKTNTKI